MGWQQNKFTCCVVTGFGPIKSLRLHSLVGSPIRFSFKNHNFYKKIQESIFFTLVKSGSRKPFGGSGSIVELSKANI